MWIFSKLRDLRDQNEDLLKRNYELQAELSRARESYDLLREQIMLSQEAEIEQHRRMVDFFALRATGHTVFGAEPQNTGLPEPVRPARPTIDEIARQRNDDFFRSHRPVAMGVPIQQPQPSRPPGDSEELNEETA